LPLTSGWVSWLAFILLARLPTEQTNILGARQWLNGLSSSSQLRDSAGFSPDFPYTRSIDTKKLTKIFKKVKFFFIQEVLHFNICFNTKIASLTLAMTHFGVILKNKNH